MRKIILCVIVLFLTVGGYVNVSASNNLSNKRNENLKTAIFNQVKVKDNSNRFMVFNEDLNGDGWNEAIVYLWGPDFTTSFGDTVLIFNEAYGEFEYLSKVISINMPIVISSTKSNGYNDIVVNVSGGSIKKSYYSILKNEDGRYPLNPVVQPKANITQSNVKRVLNTIITPMSGEILKK